MLTSIDSKDRAEQIINNVKSVKEAYGLDENDPALIYINDFMELEMREDLVKFNLDDNS